MNSGTRQRDKQSETCTATCGGFFLFVSLTGSGANRPGGAGSEGGRESEVNRGFKWEPVSRNGTRKSGLGLAIDYSHLLGLKLCLPQIESVISNVGNPFLAPLRQGNSQQFQFQFAQFPMTGGNLGNGTRPITVG